MKSQKVFFLNRSNQEEEKTVIECAGPLILDQKKEIHQSCANTKSRQFFYKVIKVDT